MIAAPAVTGLDRLAVVDAHEGPVYRGGENALYFTAQTRIKRLGLDDGRITVVECEVTRPNGMTLDQDGSLIVCDQGDMTVAAQLRRVDPITGVTTTLVDSWMGRPLNSPNDVRVRSDATIWFTDPSYGYLQGFRPAPQVGDHVYRFDPASGDITVVDNTLDKPNGLSFSPDERLVYVGDSGAPNRVMCFYSTPSGVLASQGVLAVTSPGTPDGITVDVEGRVYVSSTAGVLVYSPTGSLLGRIEVPGAVNFTFGGAERNLLFITADDAIWVAALDTKGA